MCMTKYAQIKKILLLAHQIKKHLWANKCKQLKKEDTSVIAANISNLPRHDAADNLIFIRIHSRILKVYHHSLLYFHSYHPRSIN